jgi:heme-degrading monooxygenase HmoA
VSNPIAVILRFSGDPDDLLQSFEQARKSWTEAQGNGYNPPIFFATCKADEGIVLVTGWEAEEDHKAFRKQMMPCLHAAGVGRPTAHEQLEITWLGWGPVPAEAS